MTGVTELSRRWTTLGAREVGHLLKLVATWDVLADLCFSDLLLWAAADRYAAGASATGPDMERFVVLAHVRPMTAPTIYTADVTGRVWAASEHEVVARAYSSHEIVDGEIDHPTLREPVRVLAIPVAVAPGKVIGVLTRESVSSVARRQGELERTYQDVFRRFAEMIARGEFPYQGEVPEPGLALRVGDGLLLLDEEGRVEFASPNAVSTLVHLGVSGSYEGLRLSQLGIEDWFVKRAMAEGTSIVTAEIEPSHGTTVLARCLPLLGPTGVTGAVVLMRDISELRVRDRLLVSKDATIREIHHRVKNNLQTISSLLRLQARRLNSKEAKAALEESVRRIRTIALVHETLSREQTDDVDFSEVVRSLVRMVRESLVRPESEFEVSVRGEAGRLPAQVATPLAVVLTELLQNVVDHAYPEEMEIPPRAHVEIMRDEKKVVMVVRDRGVGVPEGFSAETTAGLGLQIVKALIVTELGGSLQISRSEPADAGEDGSGPGTVVRAEVPLTEPDAARSGVG
ncbi:MAG: ATPase [Acidimicrobiales bacterium]|nr:MAG: ATPase [Acidimicrobiales bacterium]